MKLRMPGILLAGLAAAAVAVVGAWAPTTASAAQNGAKPAAQAGSDGTTPPSAVEDFTYPLADRILKEKGIVLRKGDGHILLTECSEPNQIQVWTRQNAEGKFCFRVIGRTGNLTLEVNEVFAVQTEDRAVRASLTSDGKSTTVDIPKDELKPVGEGTTGKPTVLVELKVTG